MRAAVLAIALVGTCFRAEAAQDVRLACDVKLLNGKPPPAIDNPPQPYDITGDRLTSYTVDFDHLTKTREIRWVKDASQRWTTHISTPDIFVASAHREHLGRIVHLTTLLVDRRTGAFTRTMTELRPDKASETKADVNTGLCTPRAGF